jgi:superfamily II DNA or RNA helicase
MNCNCDFPARYLISRDGKPCYTCSLGRCRFYALAPVQSDGYTRVTLGAPGFPPADVGVVLRFEALVHPDHKDLAAFMIRVQGDPQRWAILRSEVLQDPQFEGMWYTTAKAFLYPMSQYSRVVSALRAHPLTNVVLEEIPYFYFRCVERLRQIPLQYSEDVAAGRARRPDPDDCVFRQLKPFQKDGVRFVIAHQGRAMIADDMGLGKTVQAIAVAHHYRDEWPVLVVCPMSLLENWAKEFNRFCGIPFTRIAILQGTKATATSLQDVVIVSYNSLKCVEAAHFGVVILDESHYIKAGAAKRAQLSLKICRESRRVLLLSGTPAMSRPIELYAQLQAMQPTIVPSKTNFGARYCNSYVSRFGVDLTGHSHTDELHSLLRHYVIRRTKKELGDELPSKSRQLLYMYITDKEKKAMEKQIVALRRSLAGPSCLSPTAMGGGFGGNMGGANADLSARTPNAFEMKMATARAKIPAVQDYVSSIVEQHLDSGEKLILFAHHQCMMEALKTAVEAVRPRQPIDYIYISGDTPAAQREPAAEHFRTEPTCTVAILSMQSSGTGHNFTCASTVVFTELDWNPSTHLQCEDRVHRIGQAQPCHIKYLLAEGTSDSVIWPLLQTKLSVTTAMFENISAAAEVHLYDGADKQNVARRDVAAVATAAPGAASATSATPSPFQQSTLDRFMPLASPSQSMRGDDGAANSRSATPRASLYSQPPPPSPQPPQQCQSDLLTTEGDVPGATTLPLTPTNLSQQLSDSLMGSPLSTARGSCNATTLPTAPLLVVPFAEMGNVFAEPPPPPPLRLLKHTVFTALSPTSGGTAAASGASASHRAGRPRPTHDGGETTISAPSAISVLELLKHSSSKSPRAAASVNTACAAVVDLTTETAVNANAAPSVRQGQGKRVPTPPIPPSPSAASHVAVTLAAASAGVTAAPRRTVFTFGSTASAATIAATSAHPAAPSMVVAESTSGDSGSHVTPPPAPSSPPTVCNGAVHIPLRPNLHFKRPRSDVEPGGGRGGCRADAHPSEAPSLSATPRVALPPVHLSASSRHGTITTAAVASPSFVPPTPSVKCVDTLTPISAAAIAVSASVAAPPRRTLFKLVSNARPAQPHKPQ